MHQLARSWQSEPDLQSTLDAIVHAAMTTIPGAGHAALVGVDRHGQVTAEAATDDLARTVNHLQHHTQGPNLDTIQHRRTVRVDDLRTERRWSDFSTHAADLGIRSVLTLQLLSDRDLGALNLYAQRPHAFDDNAEQDGLLLAGPAAVVMDGALQRHHLRAALTHRDVIGQAKGILMERHKITAEQAFRMLRHQSQTSNRKLHDIAAYLADTGQFPPR